MTFAACSRVVTLKWERGGAEFSYQKYPRDHTWSFDGGHTMRATAAPAYLGNPAHVDPEEAFVASLSSCHMLTFLAIACKQKFVINSYEDEAVGHLEKNADGKLAITRVELRPKITWGGDRKPSAEELDKMHHAAHENCFIANSVRTVVTVTKLYFPRSLGVRPKPRASDPWPFAKMAAIYRAIR